MSRIYQALNLSEDTKLRSIAQTIAESESPAGAAMDPDAYPADYAREDAETVARAPHPEQSHRIADPEPVPAPAELYATVPLRVPQGVPVFPFDGSDPRAAEQYRILRTNIRQHPLKPRVIAVSSATPGDGKTITTINIAGALALKSDAAVLIVDADLRRCSLAESLGIKTRRGLPDVLCGRCRLEDAIFRVEQLPNLYVLPSFRDQVNPAELLDSKEWASVVAELRARFATVVIDTTPIGAVADFKLVSQQCDGVLMVVRPDHTSRKTLAKAFEIAEKQNLLGVVVNAFKDWFLWSAHEQYGYYLGRGDENKFSSQ